MAHPELQRPFGVTVIVILSIVSATMTILAVLAIPMATPLADQRELYALITPFDVGNVLLTPAQVILAFGLWHLKRWAWVVYMIQLGLSMIVNLQSHFSGTANNFEYLLMASNVVIVFYLNQREVQRAFGYKAALPITE